MIKQAKLLAFPDIGEIIRFTYDGTEHRGVLRQIAHDGNNTYIMIIDPDYDTNRNYDTPEYVLDHDDTISFEEQ